MPNYVQALKIHDITLIFAGMEWETYLEQKKIEAAAYKKGDPEEYNKFKELFYQLSETALFTTTSPLLSFEKK